MEPGEPSTVLYKRSRFVTHLPLDRVYSSSHYWLREQQGIWRIGLTKFATRILGEIVDYGFDSKPGALVQTGQVLGWIEGFKAISDLLSLVDGEFRSANPSLTKSPEPIDRDCYGEGWLYEATGTPDARCMDVQGYKTFLDDTIDGLLEKQQPPE